MSIDDNIEEFTNELRLLDTEFLVELDSPDDVRGEHFIDIARGAFSTEVTFRLGFGFGVFVSDGVFGQRPDEVFKSPKKAAARIDQLKSSFLKDGHISPLGLAEMRGLSGLTQVELAERLGIAQSSVNKAEKRGNPKLESIAGYIEAMGGRLETRVVFGDMEARLNFPRTVKA